MHLVAGVRQSKFQTTNAWTLQSVRRFYVKMNLTNIVLKSIAIARNCRFLFKFMARIALPYCNEPPEVFKATVTSRARCYRWCFKIWTLKCKFLAHRLGFRWFYNVGSTLWSTETSIQSHTKCRTISLASIEQTCRTAWAESHWRHWQNRAILKWPFPFCISQRTVRCSRLSRDRHADHSTHISYLSLISRFLFVFFSMIFSVFCSFCSTQSVNSMPATGQFGSAIEQFKKIASRYRRHDHLNTSG